jgi:hypothetical protein
MDPVGVIGLVIDVSKDLYAYYRAVSDCDSDIKELRTQLLLLHHTAASLTTALNRDGLGAEDKSQVDVASTKCEDAAGELKFTLKRIRIDGVQPQTSLEKMKAAGRKAVYPFKKSTIAGLAEDVESCQDALQVAISVLQLNVGATTVEQLAKIDERLVASTAAMESGLHDLVLACDTSKDEIVQHLLQNRKMLEEEGNRRKAMAVAESLKYPQMTDREWQISAADDSSLGGLFVGDESERHPQIMSLLTFLEEGSGLFWIQGKPASGKSMFMKYLLSRSHGQDQLWVSSDPRDTIIASHFCWIAGTTMQKSQQGLLRSLLCQILLADLALVPTACPFQWSSESNFHQWHENELWTCLHAAVSASDKQLCIFIDGLDELEPEREHVPLAKALNKLSSWVNSRIVVSSRSWPAFELHLEHGGRVLTMEENNRLAIARYIRNELEMNATDGMFTEVSWDCIYKGSCKFRHHHDGAHHLAEDITVRANGVFLWATLVMKAVCRHVAMGCPISVLESYVGKLPTELGEYFRNMIFKRIDESMLSETAMALSIALLPISSWSYFALLCNYMDTGASWLTDPDFVSALPCTTITRDELNKIIRRTATFLRGCCRDILDCDIRHGLGWPEFLNESSVTFVHRTVFDYLHTPEMQLLLGERTPSHFKDALFSVGLDAAACKMVVVDPCNPVCPHAGWDQLEFCVRFPEENNPEATEAEILYSRKVLEVVQVLEGASMYHLRAFEKLLTTTPNSSRRGLQRACTILSIRLAMRGLFSFTDNLMDTAPQLLGSSESTRHLISALKSTLFKVGYHDPAFDIGILRRLLQAGIDPNLDTDLRGESESSTPWRTFLKQLQEHPHAFLSHEEQSAAVTSSDIGVFATGDGVYANPYVQDAIKTFIEFGAELRPGDVEMLTNCLPRPDGNNFNWPRFLAIYSRPAKWIEPYEERRKRLQRWPEDWLTEEDRKLVHGDS